MPAKVAPLIHFDRDDPAFEGFEFTADRGEPGIHAIKAAIVLGEERVAACASISGARTARNAS